MTQYIKGILAEKSPVRAVIETPMGMAFELHIPISTFEVLPHEGKECMLYTHLHLAQDDVRLFGFATLAERELYQQLNRISGVGPKSALSIISTLPIQTFVRSIEREETALLTKIPGVGLKSAQRLIIELKGKLLHLAEYTPTGDYPLAEKAIIEVENALQSLGFNPKDIRREIGLMPNEASEMDSEHLIKEVIRRLYQRNR